MPNHIGHQTLPKLGEVLFRNGLGCDKCDNCFACPAKECRWNPAGSKIDTIVPESQQYAIITPDILYQS